MRVLAVTDSLAPWHSFQIRFGQYAEALPWPVEITRDPAGIDGLQAGDVLFFYRFDCAWGNLAPALRAARTRGVQVVSDVDDLLWQAPGWSRSRLQGLTFALRECSLITCSTPTLKELLQTMLPGQSVQLLPNTAPHVDSPRSPMPESPLRLGWTGAPWTRADDLALLRPLATWLKQQAWPVQWVHVGHAEGHLSFAEAIGVDPISVETHPLQSHCGYLGSMHFHIGLAPLVPSSFNACKSAIKVLEYSALSIPWLASDATPYRDLCDRWRWGGRLCRSDNDWIDQLQPLLDPVLRNREGEELKQRCSMHHSHAHGVAQWTAALLSRRCKSSVA